MAGTKLEFHSNWPNTSSFAKSSLLIFDERFKNLAWVKKFPHRYGVKSGEGLKDLKHFPKHLENILKISDKVDAKRITFVGLGGGSIGDFTGFVASIFKRGSGLVHVPSTWLSSIDSAHGGKTGLNIQSSKNQIGTFYPAEKVLLIKPLLESQPLDRTTEALGEIIKIAMISGGSLWKKVSAVQNLSDLKPWTMLKELIAAKNKIVSKDPFEKKGIRQVLNFGHTVGHVFEAELKIPHGIAVLWGLGFALQWSLQKKYIKQPELAKILLSPLGFLIPVGPELKAGLRRLRKAEKLLTQDKKRSSKKSLRFIFINKIGQTRIENVLISDILKEIKRQAL